MGEVVYGGGEMDSVEIVAGSPNESVASFDATYARCAIRCASNADVIREYTLNSSSVRTPITSGKTVFVHGRRSFAGTASFASSTLAICDSSGFPWVAIRPFLATTQAIYGNTGTGASPVWTPIGSGTKTWINNTGYVDDVRVYIDPTGAAHQVEWAVDQTQVSIGTFANTSFTNVASVTKSGLDTAPAFWSEPIITEGLSTIGAHVFTSDIDADGAHTDGTGGKTQVNEIILDDTTSWQTSTVGNKWTGTTKNFTTPVGYRLPSIFVWTRIKQSGAAPQNANILIRSGGTDYPLALASPGVSLSNVPLRMDVSPVTSATWTDTGWNAAERGVEAVT